MTKSNTNLLHLNALREFGVIATQNKDLLSSIATHLEHCPSLTIDETIIEATYATMVHCRGTEYDYIDAGIRQELLVILLSITGDHSRFMKPLVNLRPALAGIPWSHYLFGTDTPLIKDDYAHIGAEQFGRGIDRMMHAVIRRHLTEAGHEYTLAWSEVVTSMVSAFAWRVKSNGTLSTGDMQKDFWLSQAETMGVGLVHYISNLKTIRDNLRTPI